MKPANFKILVEVEYDQKSKVSVNGGQLLLAKEFSNNRRESNPTLCKVINGNGKIADDTLLLVHHGRFTENSPHHLGGNQYSLAWNSSVFARLDEEGNAIGLNENIMVEHIYDNDSPLIPEHLKVPNKHKYRVLQNGFGFKKGQIVYAFEFANYEIIYVFNGTEKRVIKVIKNDIVGKLVNNS